MDNYFPQAINTLKASRWKLFIARLLGKKNVYSDSHCTVTIYTFKGTAYITDFEVNHD